MPPKKTNWVDHVFPYYDLIRIFNFYLDMECWIISGLTPPIWNPIRYHNRASWPIEFDDVFGIREERARFNQSQIEKTVQEKKIQCATFNGLSSFFVPIVQKGESVGVLQAGVFLRKGPDRETLLKQWQSLTGTEASGLNPDFSRYVHTFLETPLVEGPVYRGLQDLLELYARVTAGEADPEEVCRRASELKNSVFARHLPHRFWAEKAVKNNRVYPPTWWIEQAKADQWRKEEQGIERTPTTILALMIEADGGLKDDLDLTLKNYFFQKELFKFSRSIPNTVASPLEDYGVLYFTSPDPDRNEVQSKLEILDKVDLVSRFVDKRFQAKVLVGVSRCRRPDENLSRVLYEAVTSLGFCRPLGRPILFYEDVRTNPTIPKPAHFYTLSTALIDAYTAGAVGEIEWVRNRYIEQILSRSAGRPENVRLHFLYAFGQIVDVLRKRSPVQSDHFLELFDQFETQLQEARAIADLIAVFRESLKRLLELGLKPMEASQNLRLEAAKKYIDQNFNLDLKLEEVARENGFSTSVFGRGFKKVAGIGFSAYLRKVRLEQARKLLASTSLPISHVSQECGFNNLQYFFDVFKRSTGRTPQEFRDASQTRVSSKHPA